MLNTLAYQNKNVKSRCLSWKMFLTALLTLFIAGGYFAQSGQAQTKEIPYTLDDRDRMIRVEEQIKALREEMNVRFAAIDVKFEAIDAKFEAIDAKFEAMFEAMDDKMNKLYTLIYFVLGGVFGLIGLIFWDRRSFIKPVKQDIEELKSILRKFAQINPELKEIINKAAI